MLQKKSNKSLTSRSKSKVGKSKSKKPKTKSIKTTKKKKIRKKEIKPSNKLPIKKKKTKKRKSTKITITKERKVVRRKGRKKKISNINNVVPEDIIEEVAVELEGRGSLTEHQVESMPKDVAQIEKRIKNTGDNLIMMGVAEGELHNQEKPANQGGIMRIETEEMLEQVNRSDEAIKMKHKSFTNLGNRNLSFEGENKLLMHNFNNPINLPEIKQNGLVKDAHNNSEGTLQKKSLHDSKNEIIEVTEETNLYNRVLSESMKQKQVDEPKKPDLEIKTQKNDSNIITLSKANDSQLEKKLITQENSQVKTPEDTPKNNVNRENALSKDSKKIVNRSFQQTMKSIYDGVDRTLNIIEITENTEGESQEENRRKMEFADLQNMPDPTPKTRHSLDLNETLKEKETKKKGKSKREIFFEKMGVPLETMMTAPTVPSKGFEDTGPIPNLNTNSLLNTERSKSKGQEILKRHSKMSNQKVNPRMSLREDQVQRPTETRSAMGYPINGRASQNGRRVVLSRHNLPLQPRVRARLTKDFRSPKPGNNDSRPRGIMTKSVENLSVGGRRPGQYYQRWNPSVRRTNSPPLYQMNHNLDNIETLSMPGNVMYMQQKHIRPMSSVVRGPSPHGPSGFNPRMSPQPRFRPGPRPMQRQVSENFLHSRPGAFNGMGGSNYSNYIPQRMSSNLQHRPVSSHIRMMSPTPGGHINMNRMSPTPGGHMNMSRMIPMGQSIPLFQKFSREDMENRLVMLVKKVLVYSSKIESIKKKILRQNPSFTSIKMFNEFSDNKQTIDLEGLFQLFQAFGFHPPSISIYKIMIFLSNFQLESLQNQNIQNNLQNQLNNLPKEYTVTREGRLASIRKVNSNPYNRFDDQHINHNDLFNNQGMSNGGQPMVSNLSQMKSISLHEFRHLFESKTVIDSQELSSNRNNDEVKIKEIDFHLIRQIFMLVARMLDDLSKIIRTMQPYGSLEIFSYLLEFNNITKDSTVITNNSQFQNIMKPQDSIDNAIGISKGNLGNDPSMPQTSPIKRTLKTFGKKNKNGYDFTKKKKMNKERDFEEADDESSGGEEEDFRLDSRNKKIQQSPVIRDKFIPQEEDLKTVGVNTFANMLQFHNAHFISDDLHLILKALGVTQERMILTDFDRFLASPLWNL
jgi:hypothetical protein